MEAQEIPLGSSLQLSPEPELQNPHQQNEEEEDAVAKSASSSSSDHKDIVKALQIVERDSVAIAHSFTSLFSSLRSALSQVTASSVDHMSCFSDAAGRLQECALDASTKGNRYINSCLRLNEEMKSIDSLAMQMNARKMRSGNFTGLGGQ